jgi:hypothetical protein
MLVLGVLLATDAIIFAASMLQVSANGTSMISLAKNGVESTPRFAFELPAASLGCRFQETLLSIF